MRYIFLCLLTLVLIGCNKESAPQQPDNKPVTTDIPHNEIWYTTSNRKTINPLWGPSLEHDIVSNTYENNKGVMQFSGDITTIGDGLFSNVYTLTSMTLPSSVTSIGISAFDNSNKLSRIDLPATITEIGDSAFASCALTDVKIPDGVKVINKRVFAQNPSLKSVNLPDGLKKISASAFVACHALRTIDIPASVEEVERCAFVDCRMLERFNGALASQDGRALIIDSKLVAIAPYGITSYNIPEGVTTIGDSAFGSCTALQSVTIPEGVTHIERLAFSNCGDIDSITIPASVTAMGDYCFATYGSDLEIYCKPTTPPATLCDSQRRWQAFQANTLTIYVPRESVEAYKAAEYWSDYKDNIVGYDF